MGIWIRTQDKKRLMDVNDIFISFIDDTTIGTTTNGTDEDSFFQLGKYKSEERALEVLDLIQRKLIQGTKFDSINRNKRVTKEFVFKMPEE